VTFFLEFLMMALAPVAVWGIGEWMERRRERARRERDAAAARGPADGRE
jgi:hypothetical protein